MKKKALSVLLALCMALTLLPISAIAADMDGDFVIIDGVLTDYRGSGGDVIIPSSVTSIGKSAFMNNHNMRSVTIPSSVVSIERTAFALCHNLTSVTISEGVISIGEEAFWRCSKLKSVAIPNSVTNIDVLAFGLCPRLDSVTIPRGVTNIAERAFLGCTSLTAIQVDPENPNYTSVNNVLFTKNLDKLVTYPGGKQGAYSIPSSVTCIEKGAFGGCTGLTSVTISNGVTCIDDGVFYECTNLSSVTISSSVTWIGVRAFRDCESLTSIKIPDSVTKIKPLAFSGCTSLTDVYYSGSESQWELIEIQGDYNAVLTNARIHYNSSWTNENPGENEDPGTNENPEPGESDAVAAPVITLSPSGNIPQGDTAKITWEPVEGADKYYYTVQIGPSYSNTYRVKDEPVEGSNCCLELTFQDMNEYRVTVCAEKNGVKSEPSNVAYFMVTKGISLPAPTLKLLLGSSESKIEMQEGEEVDQGKTITLSWERVPNATSYFYYLQNTDSGEITESVMVKHICNTFG